MITFLRNLARGKRAKQTAVLYFSLIASLVLGIASSVITTRLLGPQAFGDFKFIQTIWSTGMLFVTFGLSTTGGNLLAAQELPGSERSLMGSLLVLACGVSLFFCLLMALSSFPIGHVYGQGLGDKIRLFSALVFVFPLQIFLQEALRGTNDITTLALLNALPQLIFIFSAIGVSHWVGFSLNAALLLSVFGLAVTIIVAIIRARPSFGYIMKGIKEVLRNNRGIGFNIYIAVLITTITAQLSQFSLAYFFDTRMVGMFALALTITMPLTMIPNAISTTFFKHFASLDRIPRKVILATYAISGVTLLVFIGVIREIILLLYSEKFIEMVPLAYVCAVGAVLHGIADVYNRYLLAHGKTRVLRTNAIILGAISVAGYVFIVAWLGAIGAAITKLMVDLAYFISMLLYYGQKRR